MRAGLSTAMVVAAALGLAAAGCLEKDAKFFTHHLLTDIFVKRLGPQADFQRPVRSRIQGRYDPVNRFVACVTHLVLSGSAKLCV